MERKCKNCNTIFIPRNNGGKSQKFCSAKCRFGNYRNSNKKKVLLANLKWRIKNPNYSKKWNKENPNKIKIYQKKYYLSHKKERMEISNKWRKNNPNQVRLYRNQYHEKNKDKINEQWNKRYKDRYKNDENFKIARTLRNRVRKSLNGTSKSTSTLKLLGSDSIEKVKKYIESKFKKGMTWENYCFDVWHIDHIKPVSSFDLTLPEEQLKAFNFKNLQPLWAKENLEKGSKNITS